MCNAEPQNWWMVFYLHEQLRKPKKPESTIVGFQKTSKRYDRDFQTFPVLRQLYAA